MDEIILVAGPPAGGKSTFVRRLVDEGYSRLNRDDVGGNLSPTGEVYSLLRTAASMGTRQFVLDNLYATVESRKVAIEVAKKVGLPIRILWLETNAAQAQFLASRRQFQKYGRILEPEEYAEHVNDPGCFPPGAQFHYWKVVERPSLDEGFSSVESVPFEIDLGPGYVNRAIILDFDGTLRVTKSGKKYPSDPDDIVILPGREAKLKQLVKDGWRFCGVSNQSGCSRKLGDPKYVSQVDAQRCFTATCRMLGVTIDPLLFATEAAGVPKSYRRKPLPGLGVELIERLKLDPSQCTYVGDYTGDKTFAERCGFKFQLAEEFFAHG